MEFLTMQRIFQQVYNQIGALASSPVFTFTAPFDMQLIHVSLVNSTAYAGTLKIGNSSDDDAYLAAENFGTSLSPAVVDSFNEFDGATAGGQFPHIAAGTVVKLTITDHGSHMADECVVLTFTEG
jgi:hypothetical protein